MIPVEFAEKNFTFGRPSGTTEDQCGSLPCYKGTESETGWPVIISAWKMSPEELEEVNKTGVIWLRIYSSGMYPVSLSGHRPW